MSDASTPVPNGTARQRKPVPVFRPPFLLGGGSRQSILGALVRKPDVTLRRERVELSDGDFVDIDYFNTPTWSWEDAPASTPICLLIHGMGGSTASKYMQEMAQNLGQRQIRSVGLNMRGTTGPNRTAKLYNGGAVDDPHEVMQKLAKEHPEAPLGVVGFSLGACITLNYAVHKASELKERIKALVAISPPLNMVEGVKMLAPGSLWNKYLLDGVKALILPIESNVRNSGMPNVDFDKALAAKTVLEFDEHFTAPLHGYKDATDYYTTCQPGPKLDRIQVDTLVIRSRDDPFLAPLDCDYEGLYTNPRIHAVITECGGHIGFIEFKDRRLQAWAEPVAADWLVDRFHGDTDIHHTSSNPPPHGNDDTVVAENQQ